MLHVRYTAREGGSALRDLVIKLQRAQRNEIISDLGRRGLYQAYVLREQFADAWSTLQSTGSTTLTLEPRHLPYLVRDHDPRLTEVKWFATDRAPEDASASTSASPPDHLNVNVNGEDVSLRPDKRALKGGLYVGTGNLVQLKKPFEVKMPVEKLKTLKELLLVVKIGLGKS